MADQRTDYGSKAGESKGKSKQLSSKSLSMTTAGGKGAESGSSGPTGSSRCYPKGGKPSLSFEAPITKGKRTGTDWAVGGV